MFKRRAVERKRTNLVQRLKSSRLQAPRKRQLRVEALEDRTLLAMFIVKNVQDSGPDSLRQAILDANDEVNNPGKDVVRFEIGTGHQTIVLASKLPDIDSEIVLD